MKQAFIYVLIFFSTVSYAEVPNHPAGSICFTKEFWCWVGYGAGKVADEKPKCFCPSSMGWFEGILSAGKSASISSPRGEPSVETSNSRAQR